MSFQELGLIPELLEAINELGYEEPSKIQSSAIPQILEGNDIVGLSETGSGKTAAFALPALQKIDRHNRTPQVLILSPTRELCVQVCEEVRKLSSALPGVRSVPVYGGAPIDRQIRGLRDAQMVVGTPGRLMDHLRRGTIRTHKISLIILDEADRMLDMGFREDMEEILSKCPDNRQTLFFSATMNKNVERLINNFGNDPVKVQVAKQNQTVSRIDQSYYEVRTRSKVEVVSRIIDTRPPRLAVVFCNTKRSVDECTEALLARGYAADRLHGDVTQQMRERTIARFRDKTIELLVATDVAARGLDIDEVDLVINYDIPQDPEDYVHRIGRTGRAGREGRAVSFVFGRDVYRLQNVERFIRQKIRREKIPSQEEVEGKRGDVLFEQIKEQLETKPLIQHQNYIDRLLEQGHTPTDIAATVFGLWRESIGREGEEIQEDRPGNDRPRRERGERRDRGDRRDRAERGKDKKKERGGRFEREERFSRGEQGGDRYEKRDVKMREGMTQLFLSLGSKLGVSPGEIAGMLYSESGISNGKIGKIKMFPKHCLVEVPKDQADKIIKSVKGAKLRGKSFMIGLDRDIS